MAWRLSRAAKVDLRNILKFGVQHFGRHQARHYGAHLEQAFQLLSEQPHMGRIRPGLRPETRIHPHGAHIIVYATGPNGIDIIRVRHGRENWQEA